MQVTHSVVSLGAALLIWPSLGSPAPTNNSCGLPLVQDAVLREAITSENLLKHSKALESIAYSTPGRNRVTGSSGHNLTVKYLEEQLGALGDYYDVEVQPWQGFVQQSGLVSFIVNSKEYEAQVVEFSPNGTVNGPLIPVPNLGCDAADFPTNLAGSIALIHRGSCSFVMKSTFAKAAGAAAVIFWNNEDAGVVAGTYGGIDENVAPAAGISQEDGLSLVALSSNTTLTATLDILTVIEEVNSANVIATSKYGDPDNVLFLGAHSDSVSEGPGINDDGSGSVGILETAIQLAKYRTKAQVKFGWWTAEEAGLLGSTYYVSSLSSEDILKIRLYLNFDMIASPNYILGHYDGDGSEFGVIGPAGSAEVEHFFEDYYESLGLNHTATEFNGRSDYGPFLDAGVPCGGLDAGADEVKTPEWVEMFGGTAGVILDPNYHQAGDNVDNLNFFAFEVMAKGIAHAVATFGRHGFADFPPRETVEKRARPAPKKVAKHSGYHRFPTTS
ncbi:putative leucine aminopeptidase 2 [Paramyrothecium foliicola]|nr:putative leucine aminopeptidase 2 [Paramyrothecium foliicola]